MILVFSICFFHYVDIYWNSNCTKRYKQFRNGEMFNSEVTPKKRQILEVIRMAAIKKVTPKF